MSHLRSAHVGESSNSGFRNGLTDLYEPYSFADVSGPGCGVAYHDEDCLCDVTLPAQPTPIKCNPFTATMAGRIATHVTVFGEGASSADFVRWAEEFLGVFEVSVKAGHMAAAAAEAAVDFHEKRGRAVGRFAQQADVKKILSAGLTFPEAAAYLQVPVLELARCFLRDDGTLTAAEFVGIEHDLRSQPVAYRAIGTKWGVSEHVVRTLAKNLGIKSEAAERLASGDGLVYTQSQLDQATDMRAGGASYREVGEMLGLTRQQAISLCRRASRAAARAAA